MNDTAWWIAIGLGYLCGTIPFGLLIGLSRGVDIRQHGSKNIGATNCGRVLGRKWGLICFVLDMLKGAGPVMAAGLWFGVMGKGDLTMQEAGRWMGVAGATVLGHVFPVWLKFRGGKGVATGFGAVMGIWPYMTIGGLGALATWLLFAGVFRYVGLASVMAAILLPVYLVVASRCMGWTEAQTWPFVTVACLLGLLIVVRHRGNLWRVWLGTESRLGGS
ncbi:MAG: glycerol-3-phosphate 1-O-acyltransferase PlsY [Planctomycetes bacterium]|nr:glycerol-3-phosphate 1-O-acyltransferase PlsY [Planctomycetota bacterium]